MHLVSDELAFKIVSMVSDAERAMGADLGNEFYIGVRDGETCDDNFSDMASKIGADWYATGMSKVCLFFNDYPDIVVKIPIHGYVTYYDDDEDCEYGDAYDYCGAKVGDSHTWDYCAAEEFIYKEAEKAGIEDMFAETEFIGETDSGYPVYASKRISDKPKCVVRKDRDKTFEYIKKNDIRCGLLGRCLVADMLEAYPASMVLDAIGFMRKFDIDGDMHCGNYMHDDNGNVVFVDYSDFRDYFDTEDC